VKYTAQITVQLDGISIEEFAEKVKAAGAIGPVSNAYVHVPNVGLGIGAIGQNMTAIQVAPAPAPAEATETVAGKPRRQRAVKGSEAQQSEPSSSTDSTPASTQSAADSTAQSSATQQTAEPAAATESPSDASPISEPAAVVPEITELRAAASEKIAADPANRPKVHAVIAEFSADKAEPAMSKIPDQFRAAALAKLKGL